MRLLSSACAALLVAMLGGVSAADDLAATAPPDLTSDAKPPRDLAPRSDLDSDSLDTKPKHTATKAAPAVTRDPKDPKEKVASTPDAGTTAASTPVPAPMVEGAPVRIGDRRVFMIRAERNGQPPDVRARKTAQVLERLIDEGKTEDVRVQAEGDLLVVYAGTTPIIQLSQRDAIAAGDASLAVHADAVATDIRQALVTEVRRRATANLVFSFSLVVLSGLIAFLLLRALSQLAQRIGASLETAKNIPGFRIGSIELLTPAAVKVLVGMVLSVLRPILTITLSYFWIVFALSLFPATAKFGERVSGFVLTPLTTLVGRVGATLPMLALLAISAFATAMLLRFVRVFFDGIGRGELHLSGIPADLARPLSMLVRIAVVAGALLVAAPLVTGGDQGTLPLAGIAMLATFVLATAVPLAGGAVGAVLMLGRKLNVGDFLAIGDVTGVLRHVGFFELVLEDRTGNELRVPHLLLLVRTLRVLGDAPSSRWEVTVDSKLAQGRVRKTLADAVRRQGHAVNVELVEIDAVTARYLVQGAALPGEDDLASAIADALTREGLVFGRIRKVEE